MHNHLWTLVIIVSYLLYLDMVDFNVQKVNKKTRTNADLDKSLLHLETNNNGTKSLSVKRGRDDEVDSDEEVLQYSDNDLPKKSMMLVFIVLYSL